MTTHLEINKSFNFHGSIPLFLFAEISQDHRTGSDWKFERISDKFIQSKSLKCGKFLAWQCVYPVFVISVDNYIQLNHLHSLRCSEFVHGWASTE